MWPGRQAHTARQRHGSCGGLTASAARRPLLRPGRAAVAARDQQEEQAPVVIVGAGIAGLATALALHKVGIPALVLERKPCLRLDHRAPLAAIGLWENAWRVLDVLGAGEQLRAAHLRLSRVELTSAEGKLLRSFGFNECDADARAGPGGSEFRGVRRAALLEALAAQLPPGCIQYGMEVERISEEGGGAGAAGAAAAAAGAGSSSSGAPAAPVLHLAGGRRLRCRALVGADGARSVVARHLGLAAPNYSGYTAYRGVATFPEGGLPLPPDTIRQVLGAGVRAGMYPISPTEVYWFTCFEEPASSRPATAEEAAAPVRGWAWGIEEAIAATPPELLTRNRIVDRWTFGRTGRGLITLAGDGAHPMTPNLGQGGCAALEDAVVLARTLQQQLAVPSSTSSGGGSTSTSSNSSSSSSSASNEAAALALGLREYEGERARRWLYLTIRSWAFGFLLQLPFPPVVAARNLILSTVFSPSHFLDHTEFDCGALPPPPLPPRGL